VSFAQRRSFFKRRVVPFEQKRGVSAMCWAICGRASSKIAIIESRLLHTSVSWKLRVGPFVPCGVLAFPLV